MNGMRRRIAGKTPTEIREMNDLKNVPPVVMDDFLQAIVKINPSVSPADIKRHEEWRSIYGSV